MASMVHNCVIVNVAPMSHELAAGVGDARLGAVRAMMHRDDPLPGFKWPVPVAQPIAALPECVWAAMSAPGNLVQCHPFCAGRAGLSPQKGGVPNSNCQVERRQHEN